MNAKFDGRGVGAIAIQAGADEGWLLVVY